MSGYDLKYLIFALISIDLAMILACVMLVRKMKLMPKMEVFEKGIKVFESLLADAENVVKVFNKEVHHKREMIKQLNVEIDKRIAGLNVIIQRAEVLLALEADAGRPDRGSAGSALSRRKEILDLAEKGGNAEEIANRLLIPRGEVKLLIDLAAGDKENNTGRSRP
jgi:hypothetical protein